MSGILVYGARENSLGAAIVKELKLCDRHVHTAGLSTEQNHVDILDYEKVSRLLDATRPEHVICTVGINEPSIFRDEDWPDKFTNAISYNCLGPLSLLHQWLPYSNSASHFVAISSNSASIARTFSSPYCMSKAALSMGIRCVAREMAKNDPDAPSIYAWELGLLSGTPMTEETSKVVVGPLTRMPGLPNGISTRTAAQAVVGTLLVEGRGMNGCVFRLDGGDA